MGFQFQIVAFPNLAPTWGHSINRMHSLMDKRVTGKKATTGEILDGLQIGRSDFLSFQFGTGIQNLSLVRAGLTAGGPAKPQLA